MVVDIDDEAGVQPLFGPRQVTRFHYDDRITSILDALSDFDVGYAESDRNGLGAADRGS